MDLRRTIETLAQELADGILAAVRDAPLREVLELVGGGALGERTPVRAPKRAVRSRQPRRRAVGARSSPKVRRVELKVLDVLRSGASFLRDEIAEALDAGQRRSLSEALTNLVARGAVTRMGAEGDDARDALYVAGESRKSRA